MPDTFRKVLKDKNFTAFDNGIFRDQRISLKAKGLLCTALSLPPDWAFSVRGLASICKEGRDAIASTLNELEEAGYLRREQVQGHKKDGTFGGTEYVFFETPGLPWPENPATDEPYTDEPATGEPYTGEPYTDEPYTENPPQLNNKQVINKQDIPPISPKGDGEGEKKAKTTPLSPELIKHVNEYANGNEALYRAILDFAENRAALKKPIKTDRGLTLLLNKLDKLSRGSDAETVTLLNEAIEHNWLSVYPVRDGGARVDLNGGGDRGRFASPGRVTERKGVREL